MSKSGGDLWDDSALIDALNHAMDKYKVLHGIGNVAHSSNIEDSLDTELATSCSTEPAGNGSTLNSIVCTLEENALDSDGITCNEYPLIQENRQEQETFNVGQIPEVVSGHFDSNGHSQLLHRYYELEEERMKIIQQLQVNSWNYASCDRSSNYNASEVNQFNGSVGSISLPHVPHSNLYFSHPEHCTMCSCYSGYHGGYVPWSSTWLSQQTQNGSQQLPGYSYKPDQISKTDGAGAAMGPALAETERTFSSLNLGSSESIPQKDKDERKETPHTNATSHSQNASSEVDLSCVLGAWYSAGYYTGRYLLEQSRKTSP